MNDQPCQKCGCPIGWRWEDEAAVRCALCDPPAPEDADRIRMGLLCVDEEGGTYWEPYPKEQWQWVKSASSKSGSFATGGS